MGAIEVVHGGDDTTTAPWEMLSSTCQLQSLGAVTQPSYIQTGVTFGLLHNSSKPRGRNIKTIRTSLGILVK